MNQSRTDLRRLERGQGADSKLVDAIAGGDWQALETAISLHGRALYEMADVMCGPSAAREILTTTFGELWEDTASFRATNLAHALHEATHRRAVDALRVAGEHRTHRAADVLLISAGCGLYVDEEALEDVVGTAMADRLARLTDDERAAIVLAYYGGYSCAELASLLGRRTTSIVEDIDNGLVSLRRDGHSLPRHGF